MSKNIDRMAVLLNNFYKTLFEQRARRFNRVLRRAISFTETLDIVDDGVTIGVVPNVARYYADLTITGDDNAPGEASAYGMTGTDRVQYGAGVLDETEMVFVIRFRPTWAATDAGTKTLFRWRDDGDNLISLDFGPATDVFEILRRGAATSVIASVVTMHLANDDLTVAFRLTSADVAVSLDGGAFQVVAGTNIPALTQALFDIGSFAGAQSIEGMIHWVLAGVGTLTDAEVAALDALGNTDPTWDDAPVGMEASFLWAGIDGTHEPTRYGEASYG